jgi:predicted P-loop ATPase
MSNTVQLHAARDARIQVLHNLGFEIRTRTTQTGEYVKASLFNLVQLLRHHPYFKDRARYDEYSNEVQWQNESGVWQRIKDLHVDQIRYTCEDRWAVAFTAANTWSAVGIVAMENKVNPVKDYFDSLVGKWKPSMGSKASKLLSYYMNAEDTKLHRAYSIRWLVSIVARAYATLETPVIAHAMLVLYGEQGIGKSTALRTLALAHKFKHRYFGDADLDMSRYKESVQSIQGKMIYELQELAKRTKDVEIEKAFLSRIEDDVRLPFKRANEQIVRRAIFARSVNRKNVNTDASGSRRFWFVDLGSSKIKIAELERDLDDIWAEIVYYYKAGVQWHLTDDEEELRIQAAEEFTDAHPLTDAVLKAAKLLAGDSLLLPVTVTDIIEHLYESEDNRHLDKQTRRNQAIINDILIAAGWRYARRNHPYDKKKRVRGWWHK